MMTQSLREWVKVASESSLFSAILILICVIVGICIWQRKKIVALFKFWHNKMNFSENVMSCIENANNERNELHKENEDIKKQIRQLANNRQDDRKVSQQYRDDIYHKFDDILIMVGEISDSLKQMQEKEAKSTRASIKDKIHRIYAYCDTYQKITDMQWDTLQDLIADYEENGGDNSFIHSKVMVDMYKWERVDDRAANRTK